MMTLYILLTLLATALIGLLLVVLGKRKKTEMQTEIRKRVAQRKRDVEARRRETKPWGF